LELQCDLDNGALLEELQEQRGKLRKRGAPELRVKLSRAGILRRAERGLSVRVELPYRDTVQSLEIPQRNLACVVEPKPGPRPESDASMIAEALDHPFGVGSLSEALAGAETVAVVVDDLDRPTPVYRVFPLLLERLKRLGFDAKSIRVVMAVGTHKEPPRQEVERKVGPEALSLGVTLHNSLAKEKLTFLGVSSTGTPAWVNAHVASADRRIGVGNVAPHPWAGYGGGGKILMPGVSAWEAIGRNHLIGLSSKATIGRVDGNPIRRDMEEVAGIVGLDFILNTVHDGDGRLVDAVAGHYVEAHREGVKKARPIYEHPLPEPADILVMAFGPRDETLWQAIGKGYTQVVPLAALKEGGTLILVASCHEGVYRYPKGAHQLDGSGQLGKAERLLGLLSAGASEQEVFAETMRGAMPYLELGMKGCLLARLAKSRDVIVATQGLNAEEVKWLGTSARNAEEALKRALETQGRDAQVVMVPGATYRSSGTPYPLAKQ